LRGAPAAILVLVAISGFCGLVYQVVWERALRYHFGGDSISAAIVTGTFLLGLGLGALLFGRWHRRAFRVYALVEAAIGMYGLFSFHILTALASALGGLFATAPASAEGVRPVVILAAVLFLLPPTVLIGATSPLMFNCFVGLVGASAYAPRTVGLIYGVNTLGAAVGILAAPFVLLNRLSLPVTLAVAGAGNLLLATALWTYGARRDGNAGSATGPDGAGRPSAPHLTGLAFLSGFLALAFEVTLVRALFVQNPSSPYNFPAVLIPFLLAIAVGSAVFTRFRHYDEAAALQRVGLLFGTGALAMMLAVTTSATLSLKGYRAALFSDTAAGGILLILHATLLGVSLPLFTGAVLPLVLRLAAPTGRTLPGRAGPIFLANSIGAFGGAVLTQFVGFPLLGTRGVILGLLLLGLAAGLWCLQRAGVLIAPRRRLAAIVASGAAAAAFLIPAASWRAYVTGLVSDRAEFVEGVTGVAVIDWQPSGGDLIVNGQYMSRLPDHPRHVRLVSFALAAPRRERVLLLGLGGGGMVRHLVHDPLIRQLEVVDWSYELPRLLDAPRARETLDRAIRHEKVRLCRCDARIALDLHPAGSFDVVIDNLTVAHWVGATSVKSIEYFRRVRRVLAPGGIFVYHGNWGGARRAILAGLTETFAHVRLQPGTGPVDEVVLAAEAEVPLDPAHAARVLEELRRATGIVLPRDTLAGLVPVHRSTLGRARPVRDDLLIYEYRHDPVRTLKRLLRALFSRGRSSSARGGVG
jgi:spermidine synthase